MSELSLRAGFLGAAGDAARGTAGGAASATEGLTRLGVGAVCVWLTAAGDA